MAYNDSTPFPVPDTTEEPSLSDLLADLEQLDVSALEFINGCLRMLLADCPAEDGGQP